MILPITRGEGTCIPGQLGKMYFLHNMENLCNLADVFMHGESIVNLIARMVGVDIKWKQCVQLHFSWKLMIQLFCRLIVVGFNEENMANQITRQFSY